MLEFWTGFIKFKLKLVLPIIFISIILVFIFYSNGIPKSLKFFKFQKKAKEKFREISPKNIFKWIKFSEKKALKSWKNKIFKGKTAYWIDAAGDEKFLHSKSDKTASALYYLVSYKIENFPIITWRWKAIQFPNKDNVEDPKLRDDYALRFYVIFASGFFTNFRVVEYVWDEKLEEGTKIESPYSEKIMQLVIRSGPGTGEWVYEERNVLEDYISLFGEKPKLNVRAISVMSDSEGTGGISEGCFKEIRIIKDIGVKTET